MRLHRARAALLERYDWPGNVRELRNALEHALVIGDGDEIRPEDLPARRCRTRGARRRRDEGATLEEIERRCLAQALVKTDFNRTRAARLLGITRRTLGYRLRKYELEDELAVLRVSHAARPREPLRVRPARAAARRGLSLLRARAGRGARRRVPSASAR